MSASSSSIRYAPTAWYYEEGVDSYDHIVRDADGVLVCRLPQISSLEMQRRGRLIAAAPNHALVAYALCSGIARWEVATGEFCIGGLRYSTTLDEFGVPVATQGMRAAIAKAQGAATPVQHEAKDTQS